MMRIAKAVFFAVLAAYIPACDSTALRVPVRLFGKRGTVIHEEDIINVYQRASPCVALLEVYHHRVSKPKLRQRVTQLFGKRDEDTVSVKVSGASGLLWDDEGHIVTNHHCYYSEGREAFRVKVKLPGISYRVNAELVGSDLLQDIAVLKIIPAHLEQLKSESIQLPKPLDVGSSRSLQVGQTVLAIGNQHGRSGTMTNGVITSLDRDVHNPLGFATHGCIQTNASVGKGSSGSPLLNCWGQLIGIHVATSVNAPVMNYSIPVDTVKRVVTQIIHDGKTSTPVLGIVVLDTSRQDEFESDNSKAYEGAVIIRVLPESPAAEAGLVGLMHSSDGESVRVGEMIVGADGKRVQYKGDLHSILDAKEPGDIIELTIAHADDRSKLVVVPIKVACMEEYENDGLTVLRREVSS